MCIEWCKKLKFAKTCWIGGLFLSLYNKHQSMKNILLFLSLFWMSLLAAKGVEGTLPDAEGAGVESVLRTSGQMGCIQSSIAEFPDEGMAYVETESLARQYRVCGRSHRSFSVHSSFFAKSSAYRAAKKRLELLSHTINQVYTSLPCQSWAVSSDHYVFGMRRILI